MARRLILDTGAVIAYTRGDRQIGALLKAANLEGAEMVVSPAVVTQTIRGGGRDTLLHRLFRAVYVPFVGLRLARLAGELLGVSGLSDAADAQVMAEAIRGGPCVLVTSDPNDMTQLAGGRSFVRIMAI